MTTYSEEEIRRAAEKLGFAKNYADALIGKLMKDDHSHDFADTDTITVKEVREAFRRMLPNGCTQCGASFHGKDIPSEAFLRNISEAREPSYPPYTVWQDKNGVFWYRTWSKEWLQFGSTERFADSALSRPLRKVTLHA